MNDMNAPNPPPSTDTSALAGPAIALMVVAGIGILYQIANIVVQLGGMALSREMGGNNAMMNMMSGTLGMVFGVIGIAIGGFIIFGAMKMKSAQNYNMAMAATVTAMVPCISPCCWFGLPVGIWALVILLKPEIKSAFTD